MKIRLDTGYNKTHGFLSLTPETSAEFLQYAQLLLLAKNSRVHHHTWDDMEGGWGLSFHLPFLPEQTDYQI